MEKPLSFADRLAATQLSQTIQSHAWVYPGVEILHIIALAFVLVPTTLFDFRLLGFVSDFSVQRLARILLPLALVSFAIALISGFLLFLADPPRLAENRALHIKILLIGAAGLNAFCFHRGVFRSVSHWDQGKATPLSAKAAGLISLGLWLAVLSAGRLIAYI